MEVLSDLLSLTLRAFENLFCDVALNNEDVSELIVVIFSPNLFLGFGIDNRN